ncbi:InlB B-repeat-containing protein, partial [Candidatus Saccharibacteria bacterium]|nr:InlB B-repeat-containing protein [Candidatus Saccharibacteria bacterium]
NASSGSTYNGKWGLKPSKYYNTSTNTTVDNTDTTTGLFFPAPTVSGFTIAKTNCANSTSTVTNPDCPNLQDTYTFSLGARADYTQIAGTYTNTYVLQAVGNPINYSISYTDDSGDSTVSGVPTTPTSGSTGTTGVTLSSATPTRTGYTFTGWCNTTTTESGTLCNGSTTPTYTAGGLYGIDQTTVNTATLHALWSIKKYGLTITFAGSGVSSVAVKSGSASGTTVGTVSASGGSVANLTYNTTYYLVPTFTSTNYILDSWSNTGSYGTLSSTTATNPTFTIGAGNGAVTITGKSNSYTISYNANNGTGSISDQTVTPGNSVVLADNAFTRNNYYFKGWATSSDGSVAYRTNQTITPTSNMTLYAVWGSSTSQTLYNIVSSLTRGNQTNDTNATTGIKTNPTKATSGVWTYDSSVFGESSDASNDNPIYYYRGILDATTGSYGSDGDAMDYPNYVKMTTGSNTTCWRIVRTTGSGGVKMIYNGVYGATTSGSCANATTNAQLTTSAFNATSNVGNKSIIAVGYTFNSNYKTTTASTTAGNLFGTNSSYTGNNTRSTIKTYIEDTWYASNMTSWTSKLEASAGYCNDRSIYDTSNNLLSDTTSISTPYTTATSGITQYNFGARQRNFTTTQAPSLTCPYNARDLYRYVASSTGVSNQLKYPAALLTADELSFAGSGSSTATNGSGYNANSYLRSGSDFWLLSPSSRNSSGGARGCLLRSGGTLYLNIVHYSLGVRPAISLASGTTAASGSGTATDPWVVQ